MYGMQVSTFVHWHPCLPTANI